MFLLFTEVSPVVKTISSPSRSNQIGVTWGAPFLRVVASLPVLGLLVRKSRHAPSGILDIAALLGDPSCRPELALVSARPRPALPRHGAAAHGCARRAPPGRTASPGS